MTPEDLAAARRRYMTDDLFHERVVAAAAALHEHYPWTPGGGIDTGDDDARTVALIAVLAAVTHCARCPHPAHPYRTCLAGSPVTCGCIADVEEQWQAAVSRQVSAATPAYPRRDVSWSGPVEPVTVPRPTCSRCGDPWHGYEGENPPPADHRTCSTEGCDCPGD